MNGKKSWQESIRDFVLPRFDRVMIIRLLVTAAVAGFFFLLFTPCVISGSSMEPSWHDGSITLSFRLRYLFSKPARGDVVTISFFGKKKLLKRVVALPGDVVEFRDGRLFVNGEIQKEPYVKNPCSWSMDPVEVQPGYCFVVGDNRDQAMDEHLFGEVLQSRISGGVLF